MTRRFYFLVVALPLVAASVDVALPVPEEEKDGVFLRIEGFDPLPRKNNDVWDRSNRGAPEIASDGPSDTDVFRSYAGTGLVLEKPGKFTYKASGNGI